MLGCWASKSSSVLLISMPRRDTVIKVSGEFLLWQNNGNWGTMGRKEVSHPRAETVTSLHTFCHFSCTFLMAFRILESKQKTCGFKSQTSKSKVVLLKTPLHFLFTSLDLCGAWRIPHEEFRCSEVLGFCPANVWATRMNPQELIPFLGTDKGTRKLPFRSGCKFKHDSKNSNSDYLKVELQVKIPAVDEQKDF